jgi:hypothetical protein
VLNVIAARRCAASVWLLLVAAAGRGSAQRSVESTAVNRGAQGGIAQQGRILDSLAHHSRILDSLSRTLRVAASSRDSEQRAATRRLDSVAAETHRLLVAAETRGENDRYALAAAIASAVAAIVLIFVAGHHSKAASELVDSIETLGANQERAARDAEGKTIGRVATALLGELNVLSRQVEIVEQNPSAESVILDCPIISQSLADLRPFTPNVIQRLVTVSWLISAVKSAREKYFATRDQRNAADREARAEEQHAGATHRSITLRAEVARLSDQIEHVYGPGCHVRARWCWNEMMRLHDDLVTSGGLKSATPEPVWVEGDPLPPKEPDRFPRPQGG